MRSTFALSFAALAGSVLAAPHYKEVKNVHVVVETVVQTVYITEGYETATAKHTRTRQPVSSAAAVTTVTSVEAAPVSTSSSVYVAPAPAASSSAVYEASSAPAVTTTTPAATSTSAAAPVATSTGYMSVVDTWRSKMGLKALTNSAKLESNAMDCVVSSNGQMVHKLNAGSYAQVLAPGTADDFEHVFVGGWLCEIPTLAGLDGICSTESQGWTYEGQTGHAEILTSGSYSEIGCALYAGIWACDLA